MSFMIASPVVGFDAQTIHYDNENITFTPILDSCRNTSTVFRVERANYYTDIPPLRLTYTYIQGNKSTNISKKINKYSTSNTGKYIANTTPTMHIQIKNSTLTWNTSKICASKENNTSKDNTSPSDPETPTAPSPTCPTTFTIATNSDLFEKGEKISMEFEHKPWPEQYAITYWITDATGTTVKSKYTTTNNNKKSYTVRQNTPTYLLLHAQIQSTCGFFENTKIVGIQGAKPSSNTLITIKDNEAHIQLQHLQDEEIQFFIETMKGQVVSKAQRLIANHVGDAVLTLPITHSSTEKYLKAVILYASGKRDEIYFENEYSVQESNVKIINTYTRQTKLTQPIHWYVRSEGTPPYTVSVQTQQQFLERVITKSDATTTQFKLYELGTNNTINSSVTQGNHTQKTVDTIILEHEQTLSETIKKANRSKVNITPPTGYTTLTTPTQPTRILPYVLGGVALILFIVDRRRKKQDKATFINNKQSQS